VSVYGKGIDDSIMYRKLDCRARGHLSPSRGDLELPERVGVRPGWRSGSMASLRHLEGSQAGLPR